MKCYEYYVLHDTGAKVKVRPVDLSPAEYDVFKVMSADEGYIFRHKITGKRARDLDVYAGFADLWEEVMDNPE